jgi:hypothetical protein
MAHELALPPEVVAGHQLPELAQFPLAELLPIRLVREGPKLPPPTPQTEVRDGEPSEVNRPALLRLAALELGEAFPR